MVKKHLEAVIFDLDGVLCSTDEYHYEAWKQMADEEGIPFDREINNELRGISRMASLEIILRKAQRIYSPEEKEKLCEKKNNMYKILLSQMSPASVSQDVLFTLNELKKRKIPMAIGSSSKNTKLILSKIGLENEFAAVADGNEIIHSKPDPEVFLLAAKKLGKKPEACLVVEDGLSGIEAASKGGFMSAGIGPAAGSCLTDYPIKKLSEILNLF